MVRSLKEATRELERWVEKAREVLPLTRGGKAPRAKPPTKTRTRKKVAPLKRVKVFNERPFFDGEEVRWIPTPAYGSETMPTKREINIARFEEQRRSRPQEEIELESFLDSQPDPETAYLELRELAGSTQNQELENTLASIARDRPRQFSSQFSRINLAPAPKKKRKVSAYSKRFGIELKKLKKLHPRTKVQNLMKKAHRRTRAAMKKK